MKVDLLLVNPGNRLEQFAGLSELATVAQPLGLAMIASFVRQKGFTVAIIDAEAEGWTPEETIGAIGEYTPRLIGLSAFTTKMTSSGKILKLIKERTNTPTMIGGHHASATPFQTLNEEAVDFVVAGEGFIPTLEILRCLGADDYNIPGVWYRKEGGVIGRKLEPTVLNLNELPSPAWDLLPMSKYKSHHWQAWDYNLDQSGFAVIYTSLGCPFSCNYCSVNVVYGRHSVRYRSIDKVVTDIEMLYYKYGVKHLEIVDDTFTLNPTRVEAFCDSIVRVGLGNKLNMWCFARANTVTPHLMEKMKQSGINWVFMGLESGDDSVLSGANKRQDIEQIKRAVQIVHESGIHIGGNYVFGLPDDTQETMRKTLDLAVELNTEYANFFELMAYPGTKIREMAIKKGYPLPSKWSQYGFFTPDALPLRNEHLTANEILKFRDDAFNTYFKGYQYQAMIKERFGKKVLEFLNKEVLSKKIVRTTSEQSKILSQKQ